MSAALAQKIDELMTLAAVPSERQPEARAVLTTLLRPIDIGIVHKSRMRSLFDAASQRGTPTAHNAPLERIEKAAKKLEAALVRLRRRGYSHSDFWMAGTFGLVYEGQIERAEVFDLLGAIQQAARLARFEHNARPKKLGQQRVVNHAVQFFKDYSSQRPSGDVKNPLRGFTLSFYREVVGTLPRGKEPLTRQIRQALKAMQNRAASA